MVKVISTHDLDENAYDREVDGVIYDDVPPPRRRQVRLTIAEQLAYDPLPVERIEGGSLLGELADY